MNDSSSIEDLTGSDAYQRTTISHVPQDRTGRGWRIEVHRPAVAGKRVATTEHMGLSYEEAIAVYDHLSETIPGLRKP